MRAAGQRYMRPVLSLLVLGCQPDEIAFPETTSLAGPYSYDVCDAQGRVMLDALFVLTPDALAENEATGSTPRTSSSTASTI